MAERGAKSSERGANVRERGQWLRKWPMWEREGPMQAGKTTPFPWWPDSLQTTAMAPLQSLVIQLILPCHQEVSQAYPGLMRDLSLDGNGFIPKRILFFYALNTFPHFLLPLPYKSWISMEMKWGNTGDVYAKFQSCMTCLKWWSTYINGRVHFGDRGTIISNISQQEASSHFCSCKWMQLEVMYTTEKLRFQQAEILWEELRLEDHDDSEED